MRNNKNERTCIVCRQHKQKNEMLRVVKTANGEIQFDESGCNDGRGAYVCNNKNCVEQCVKKKHLNRALKCNVSNDIYEKLIELNDKQ